MTKQHKETFQEYWSSQGSIDYEEMCAAMTAWKHQEKRIKKLQQELAEKDDLLDIPEGVK